MSSSQAPVPISTLLTHREWVRRLARSLVHDEASADDVEQRTWLAALRRPPRNIESVRAWLARVVRSKALDAVRAGGRRAVHERTGARGEAVRSAAEIVAEAEVHKRLVIAVLDLEEPYRSTVLMRFFEDVPPRVVAERMGVPVETVRTRLRRALAALRERLGEGGSPDSWVAALAPLLGVRFDAGAVAGTSGASAAGIAGGSVMTGKAAVALTVGIAMAAGYAGGKFSDARQGRERTMMRRARPLVLIAACIGSAWAGDAPPPQRQAPGTSKPAFDAQQFVYLQSRESTTPPVLALVAADGKERTHEPDADAGLLEYLPVARLGRQPQYGVNLGDSNRVLLKFPVKDRAKFARAELRLRVRVTELAPPAPFEVGVHAVDDAWSEDGACWSRSPAFAAAPSARASVEPRYGVLRVDVTTLVREWLAGTRHNHGLLLKVVRAVPASDGKRPVDRTDPTEYLIRSAMKSWGTNVSEALAQAREAQRPVLALVSAGGQDNDVTQHEEILFATALSHPSVTELVGAAFVPVRLSFHAARFIGAVPEESDPLRVLGTTLLDAKAPALVVARADGAHVATLASIGTFDQGVILRFLNNALVAAGSRPRDVESPAAALARAEKAVAAGGPAAGAAKAERGVALMRLGRLDEAAKALAAAIPEAGDRAAEASYWLAAVFAKAGDDDKSQEILERLACGPSGDPWSLKAAIRMTVPVRMAAHESLVDPGPREAGRPDAARVALGAIDFLLREQRPDGAWPVAEADEDGARAGVTVLAAHALLRWSDDLDTGRRARATDALRRADAWLDVNVARGKTVEVNSFAAGYYLEYALERLAKDRGSREDAATAVRQLVGALCGNGGWAYSKQFGDGWKGGFAGWPETTTGRAHSVNSGLALVALSRAKRAGFSVDEKALAAGVKALQAMRVRRGVYTYTYPSPRNFEAEDASLARAPLCEHALLRFGKSSKADLRGTLDLFMRSRTDLRGPVKITGGWLPPHFHSAYFFHFAYYHAACALVELGDETATKDLQTLLDDLLGWAEPDGTWVDYLDIGKPYGAASGLLVLRLAGVRLGE